MLKGVPQTMDITSIKAILHNLSKEILPSKFEAAQQPEPNTIQIGFRGINNFNWIEVCWQGDCARIIKIDRPDKQGNTSTLARQLSCGLKYMALVAIKQEKFERVIQLEFAKRPGDEISKFLIFELMGKHSNIFYLDKSLKIIAVGKQIKSNQSSYRTISTGDFYSDPPINKKKEPHERETFIDWKENLLSSSEPLKNCLINNYQGVSPILTRQLEYYSKVKINNIMNQNIELIDDENLKEIFQVWKEWLKCFKNNNFHYSNFDSYFYSVWSSKLRNQESESNLINGISSYYVHFLKLKKIETTTLTIENIIFKQLNIEQKSFNVQSKLLKNSENHEDYKIKADNIFLNMNLEKKNIMEAEKLYKKSKKLKRAKNLIRERLDIYCERLKRLDEFGAMLENLKSINVGTLTMKINLLEELKDELCDEFEIYLKGSKKMKIKSKKLESSPTQIKSPGGIVIHIGRNMRQNDLISFKLAKKQDLWFHAQESPGSHIVLKASSKIPSENDIQIAADLAAYFSRAKGNLKVPINLVKIKDLQKISKSGLGCVSFKESKIIWGNPTTGKDYIKNDTQK